MFIFNCQVKTDEQLKYPIEKESKKKVKEKKKDTTNYPTTPYYEALNILREFMLDLDSITATVENISC